MLSRALIVLLLALNFGVAAWWLSRGDAVIPDTTIPQPANVPRLQLLREAPAAARSTPATQAPSTSVPVADDAAPGIAADVDSDAQPVPGDVATEPTQAAAERCFAIGPFDEADAPAARTWLQARADRLSERRVAATTPRGWRVWMPSLAGRDEAQAVAARINAAGFKDYFILTGNDANGIALGRYGSEATARQRETTLRAAGFAAAIAEPLGGTPAQVWFDVAATDGLTPAAVRGGTRATQIDAVDCARVS